MNTFITIEIIKTENLAALF